MSGEGVCTERSWAVIKGLVKQRQSPQTSIYFCCFFCNRTVKTSQGKMSIVGFRVVPNNNDLNACTCVCPAGVPHLAALWAAVVGLLPWALPSEPGAQKSAGPQPRRASSHVRLEGFVYGPAIWALLSVPQSELMSSNDSLQVCGSCSC